MSKKDNPDKQTVTYSDSGRETRNERDIERERVGKETEIHTMRDRHTDTQTGHNSHHRENPFCSQIN